MRFVLKMRISIFLLLLSIGAVHATGQVTPAARGGGSQMNVFGMFTANKPDYGTKYTYGGTGGVDYRFGYMRYGQPAIAARFSFVPGGIVGENTYLVGPEWHARFQRFRPYGDFHIGLATISYAKRTEEVVLFHVSSRNGLAYEFGGGVDYRLSRKFGLRLGDFQYQEWNMGKGNVLRGGRPPIINGTISYTPYQLSTGLYYRFR